MQNLFHDIRILYYSTNCTTILCYSYVKFLRTVSSCPSYMHLIEPFYKTMPKYTLNIKRDPL